MSIHNETLDSLSDEVLTTVLSGLDLTKREVFLEALFKISQSRKAVNLPAPEAVGIRDYLLLDTLNDFNHCMTIYHSCKVLTRLHNNYPVTRGLLGQLGDGSLFCIYLIKRATKRCNEMIHKIDNKENGT